MVQSGTSSVPAFEAYLQGLAYGISTLQSGDKYQFLSAREAYERAIGIDPEFAKAHWQLANFWTIQLSTTNIVAGLTDMDRNEMQALYEEAIDNAILHEKDPVDQTKYRAFKANIDLKFRQALRLNAEYLEQRPLDQQAQNLHLTIVGSIGSDAEIIDAVRRFEAIDGHDRIVTNNSITRLTYSGDMDYLRDFVRSALQHWPDDAFVHYQAHRALLWAGDVDAAAQVMPLILASDVPEDTRNMVLLRQACAERRIDDARKLYQRALERFADDYSIVWLSHKIMGDEEAAIATLADLDDPDDLTGLADFLTYSTFDPRPFPNLMALLESQGIERREPIEVAYRCNR
jgi:tetratricopeptide (TPR) repeat protein